MDKLILIPILLAALYFLYKHVRKSLQGEGECHGNCAKCSRELMRKMHGNQVIDRSDTFREHN